MLRSPDRRRTATATGLHAHGRTEPGPWLIERADLPRHGGPPETRARAHAGPATPAAVIAALALTDPDEPGGAAQPDTRRPSTGRAESPLTNEEPR